MEMVKINLILAVHNHQPVGNFEWVLEKAYRESYLPFIDILSSHPEIKVSLHYSGALYDWLESVHPELLERVGDMTGSGQIEPLTGAYYEPILPLIPDRDKIGQIKRFSLRLKSRFNLDARGMWLAERVWEPGLARPIASAGVNYTLLDDGHFKAAGIEDEDLFGYYITEEAGFTLRLFPISQRLRYLIPFASRVEEVIEYLRGLATPRGERLIVLGDDGEKFGLWPGTFEWVYKKGWLDRFFFSLEENRDWIKISNFREWLEERGPLGRIYLPASSYQEMNEWAGGFHRNFLVRYHEANLLHKKMLYVSDKIDRFGAEIPEVDEARSHLYKAQCNCPYWHGIFGGLYLPHLRSAIYHHLIEAESIIDRISHPEACWLDDEITDLDRDGHPEVLINTPGLNLYFAPQRGGSLFELDHKGVGINLLDLLTRRREPYHQDLLRLKEEVGEKETEVKSIHDGMRAKEEGLENYLVFDRYQRASLLDHFFPAKTSLAEFEALRYTEAGDFLTNPYSYTLTRAGKTISLLLEREGRIRLDGEEFPLMLKKCVEVEKGASIEVGYELLNLSMGPFAALFGVEFNLAPGFKVRPSRGKERSRIFRLKDDSGLKIIFEFEGAKDIWHFPVYSVSRSEGGFERILQCTTLLPNWHLSLSGGTSCRLGIKIQITSGMGG